MIHEFYAEQNISSIRKYVDTKWSAYVKRLLLIATSKNMALDDIYAIINKADLPRDIQLLLLVNRPPINQLIENLKI